MVGEYVKARTTKMTPQINTVMDCQAGDTVQLKSGGPKMTVERIGSSADSNAVLCFWFEGHKLHEQWFKPTSIRKFEE